MHLTLIAVGTSMPSWVQTGFEEYRKRLPAVLNFHIIEIEPAKRIKTSSLDKILTEEGKRMLAAIPKNNHIIALTLDGENWDTPSLANKLHTWQQEGQSISLLIGGPDGLAPACLKVAKQSWSLSRLTFPHPLVRIIIAEQLYRAWSLLQGHPYHR